MSWYIAIQHIHLQRLVCVLLCICSWRGPVPILHHHDEFAGHRELREAHLLVFHESGGVREANGKQPDRDQPDGQQSDGDWHWHIIVPTSLPSDGQTDQQHDAAAKWLSLELGCAMAFRLDCKASSEFSLLVMDNTFTAHDQYSQFEHQPARPAYQQPASDFGARLNGTCLSALTGVSLI